jgi:hypothetical protein
MVPVPVLVVLVVAMKDHQHGRKASLEGCLRVVVAVVEARRVSHRL